MANDDSKSDDNEERQLCRDAELLASKFEEHRLRLTRMLAIRLDAELASRISESDVLQDVFVEVSQRIKDFDPDRAPFFLWLRSITIQRMIQLRRFHLQTAKRTTAREVGLSNEYSATADALAPFFAARISSVGNALQREELAQQIRQELESLAPLDREIISLRHFELLSHEETAKVLGMNPSTVSTRYLRALKKLRRQIEANPALAEYVRELT